MTKKICGITEETVAAFVLGARHGFNGFTLDQAYELMMGERLSDVDDETAEEALLAFFLENEVVAGTLIEKNEAEIVYQPA